MSAEKATTTLKGGTAHDSLSNVLRTLHRPHRGTRRCVRHRTDGRGSQEAD